MVALSILAGLATYTILTGLSPIKPTPDVITWLLAGNLVLVLSMVGMILWQVWSLVAARRRGTAGAGLHIRLVSLFSLIAALPAIIVAAFAAVTLNRGLDAWFSERTRAIVDSAVTVAEAYMRDHARDGARRRRRDRRRSQPAEGDVRHRSAGFRPPRRPPRGACAASSAPSSSTLSQKRIDANVTANDKIVFRAPPAEAHRAGRRRASSWSSRRARAATSSER